MTDEHEWILAQKDNLDVGAANRVVNNAQVNLIAQHLLVDLQGVAVFDADAGVGEPLEEFLDRRRQIVETDAEDGGETDGAGGNFVGLLEFGLEAVGDPGDLLAVLIDEMAGGGQPELLLAPLQERKVEQPFHRGDLLADGGLGDPVEDRRLGETPGFHQVTKQLYSCDLHN